MATFEWDEFKERRNILIHGIDFKMACHVFQDLNRIEVYDEKHSSLYEDRYVTIGWIGKVVTVVYTERGNRIRIISARLATKNEERMYVHGY